MKSGSHREHREHRGSPATDRDSLTGAIVDTAFRLHRDLGYGLLESVYERVLAASLTRQNFQVATQVSIAIEYDGLSIENAFRADLLVERRVLVELKSIPRLAPEHDKQVLTYMRLAGLKVGLLINFGQPILKEGIKRFVL